MDVVASLSQGRTAAVQCGLFTYKSVPVIFEPSCTIVNMVKVRNFMALTEHFDVITCKQYIRNDVFQTM